MNMNRRDFLKGTAMAGSVLTLAGLCGCSPQQSMSTTGEENDSEAVDISYNSTENFDVVVVGAGMAGLVAAISAKERGLNVALLEKNSKTGGTSACAEGMFAVGTAMQAELGFEAIPEQFVQMIEEYCHWTNNERIVKRFVEESGNGVNWMMDHGVAFTGIIPFGSDNMTWHIYEGYGAKAAETLYQVALDAGVDIRLNTSGQQLLLDDVGAVTGVIATGKDASDGILFAAPHVILSTGGISNSPEMLAKYTYIDPERWQVRGIDGRTGDGWRMGLSAGAALHAPCAVMEAEATVDGILDYEDHVYAASAGAPGLWINQDAVRFCDEFNAASNFTYYGSVSGTQPQTYVISDTSFMERQRDEGILVTTCAMLQKGSKLPDLMEKLDEAVENERIAAFRAETVDDLASQLELDANQLKATINQYNSFCEQGKDEEFHKDPSALFAMTTPPYYGFVIKPTYNTTVGGLKVNEALRVVRKDGSTIPGLYALGSDAGGVYGYTYDVGAAAGSQQGWCVTGALLAVNDIAELTLS